MIHRYRRRLLLVALFAALFLLNQIYQPMPTVQGRQVPPPSPLPQRQTADAAAPVAEAVTIRWLMRWDQTRVELIARPLIAAFEAQHPNIQVKLENIADSSDYYRALALQLDQGAPPDVFYPATHVAYALDLRQQLQPFTGDGIGESLDLARYDEEVLALYRNAGGELYCLPADMATLVVVYNKQLFAQAGVPYPNPTWNWTEFQATAQALTSTRGADINDDDHNDDSDSDTGATIYGVDRFYAYWPLLIWSWSGHNLFDDPHAPTRFLLDDEASIAALQWLADLGQSGVMPAFDDPEEDDEEDEGDLFLQGRAAMQITGHWRVPTYLAAALDFDFAPLPQGAYTVNRSDGSCFAMARNSTNADAAWTFVNWLAGEGTRFLQPPLPDHNTVAFLALEAQRFNLYDPLHPMQERWQEVADETLAALWTGEQDAAETVESLVEEAEEILGNLAENSPPMAPGATPSATLTVTPSATLSTVQTSTAGVLPTSTLTAILTTSLPITPAAAFVSPLALPRHYYVDPQGSDEQLGLSAATPFATLQHALTVVAAGDTIHLAAGDYRENVISLTAGRAAAPITIMGPTDAILRGTGAASAAFYLTHSHYTLVGFTIDGLFGDPQDKKGYTEKLLYVQGRGEKAGVTGLRVLNMRFQNAGGECLRLRYFAQHNEIAYSTFTTCGLLDFEFADGGKNGEAIYIGTSTDQWDDGKNPTADPDESSDNWIHHNVMNTQGNECVEIKEGGYANLIEHNSCTGQLDPEAAGIGSRGSGNIIRYNVVYGNVGAGVRLGGHDVDGVNYGVQNEVYGNDLFDNVAGGINITVEPQAQICGNRVERNLGKMVFGDGSEAYIPTLPCG